MTPEQAEQLRHIPKSPVFINADDWDASKPRTLLYGYTCERETFHVYVDENAVHAIIYQAYPLKLISHRSTDGEGGLPASMCVPNRRVYSEASDFDFCRHLIEAGLQFSFTSGGGRPAGSGMPFVGETFEQITASKEAEERRNKERQYKVGEVNEQFEIVDLNHLRAGFALKVYNPKGDDRSGNYAYCLLFNQTPTPLCDWDDQVREMVKKTLLERFPRHAAALF